MTLTAVAFATTSFVLVLYSVFITMLWYRQKRSSKMFTPINHKQRKALNEQYIKNLKLSTGSEVDNIRSMLTRADEARQLHTTFQKFVPRQFVDHFTRAGIDSLTLGYAAEEDVAVMFCDIRGFTRLSEKMSPQQLMNFLNSYFLRMNAPIHHNFGFIDKFIGDAIMALFDHPTGALSDKASDAVRASLDLQKALTLYNHHRANSGYAAIKSGIGLHIGPVVLGTVGSDDRMDTTVIGHTVNVAQRIESLTNYFGVDILASSEVVRAAKHNIKFAWRTIDEVVLKGKTNAIEIIEIYEHLGQDRIDARNASKDILKQAIALRNARDFAGARALFLEALRADPSDSVLVHHIATCDRLENEVDWDGTIRL